MHASEPISTPSWHAFQRRTALRERPPSLLADLGQAEAALPAVLEEGAQRRRLGGPQPRVGRQPALGGFARLRQRAGVADQAADAEVGQAVLARAEEFAGPAQLEVDLGDLETVVGVA